MKEKFAFRGNLFLWIISKFRLFSLMIHSEQIFGEGVWLYIKQKRKYLEAFSFGFSEFISWILSSNVAILAI